jgi:uncharacterized lipoprotein YmbA
MTRFCLYALPAVLAAILLGSAGCARSAATRYYTLEPLAEVAPASPGGVAEVLGVGRVQVPEYLQQRSLVVRQAPFQLHYCDFDLWALPTADAVAQVLRDNLARLTGAARVVCQPWRADDAPRRQVNLEITALEMDEAGRGVVEARWEIRDARGGLLDSGQGAYREPAGAIPALPAALSRDLLALSRDLAAALSR